MPFVYVSARNGRLNNGQVQVQHSTSQPPPEQRKAKKDEKTKPKNSLTFQQREPPDDDPAATLCSGESCSEDAIEEGEVKVESDDVHGEVAHAET